MDTIIEILEELKPGIDFATEHDLVRRRVLDSLTIIALVSELEDAFDVSIPAVEIIADNFDSAQSIHTLIERLLDEDL